MADEATGITTNDPWCFAVQLGAGRLIEINGVMSYVDGYCDKIEFPGFMTRSGASFGVTATFHFVEKAWPDGNLTRGNISRMVMVEGQLMTVDTVAEGVELVRQRSRIVQQTTPGAIIITGGAMPELKGEPEKKPPGTGEPGLDKK
ncbi:MAG: hypothetical protein HYX68_15150 [Planctomycetes bacterium]|jgi:hypothetical protein|nr:hypothetical protein [Planctomycetota bacterium]